MFGSPTTPQGAQLLASTFLNSFLLPTIFIVLMRLLGFIDDFQLEDRRQRVLPFMAVSFFFLWAYIAFKQAFSIEILSDVMLGAGIAVCVALVITVLFYKISIHTIGMGGLVALVFYSILVGIPTHNITWFFCLLILSAGLVGTARLLLDAHVEREVLGGYLVGFCCMFVVFLF